MSERAAPYFCPYCGDEDLRPIEEPHGAWRCVACLRAFVVKFVGLTGRGGSATRATEPTATDRTADHPEPERMEVSR